MKYKSSLKENEREIAKFLAAFIRRKKKNIVFFFLTRYMKYPIFRHMKMMTSVKLVVFVFSI